jgi:hypothetical protein
MGAAFAERKATIKGPPVPYRLESSKLISRGEEPGSMSTSSTPLDTAD